MHICIAVKDRIAKRNNVNKTCVLLQKTGSKDEPNMVLCRNRNGHHKTELMLPVNGIVKLIAKFV
jgi:hypothetical protein